MLVSGRIIPTILGKGWRFPGFRPLPTPWSFNSALELSRPSLVAQLVKNHLQRRRPGFDPWVGKIPWRREQLPTPVFWPGEFHGLYSTWGRKESDTTEPLSLWNCHGTSGCVISLVDWGLRSSLVSSWSRLILIACVLGLCHSFKSCVLPLSLLLQFHNICKY